LYIINIAWTPSLSNYIHSKWDYEDPQDLIILLEKYKAIIPDKIFEHFLDKFVLPILINKIETWDHLNSIFMPHIWVHPWLIFFVQNMQQKLNIVFSTLKMKFRKVFSKWKPDDPIAAKLLKPWKAIFNTTDFEDVIFRDILPK